MDQFFSKCAIDGVMTSYLEEMKQNEIERAMCISVAFPEVADFLTTFRTTTIEHVASNSTHLLLNQLPFLSR